MLEIEYDRSGCVVGCRGRCIRAVVHVRHTVDAEHVTVDVEWGELDRYAQRLMRRPHRNRARRLRAKQQSQQHELWYVVGSSGARNASIDGAGRRWQ